MTFKSGVSIVRLDALVLSKGEPVTDLAKDDFGVYDESLPQTIEYFGREAEPLSLLLVLDVSGSMRRYVERMAAVAQKALSHLRTGDRVAVMVFARRSRIRLPFTEDLSAVSAEIKRAVWDESIGSGTSINDALLDAAKYVDDTAGDNGRRAVLILTDNLGLNEKSPDDAVIQAFYSADSVLNALVVGKAQRPDPLPPGHYLNPDFTPPNVFKISEETGGEALRSDREDLFETMIERIRTRYSIQYHTPPGATGYRRLRVELSLEARRRYPNAEIRVRKGYAVR